jgi:hypothetical protein
MSAEHWPWPRAVPTNPVPRFKGKNQSHRAPHELPAVRDHCAKSDERPALLPLLATILRHRRQQAIVRRRVDAQPIAALHRFRSEERIDDRFLSGLHCRLKEPVQSRVCEHLHQSSRWVALGGVSRFTDLSARPSLQSAP